MASSSTNLDLISASQSNKEVTANALLDAASPAMLYGRRAVTSAGLTWGYYGGTLLSGSSLVTIANGTVALSPSVTNYVEADGTTGVVTLNSTGFTSGKVPLYEVDTNSSGVDDYRDRRAIALAAASDGELAAHIAASDPHTQYQKESEKGSANGYAGLGSDGKVPATQLPASAMSGGTVTSVGLSAPSAILTVSGSPVTGSGTLSMSLATQAANAVFAGPSSGGSAVPSFRALAPVDLPVMVGSGASHAAGIVPDPGSTAGTTRFLREDGTWASVAGASGGTVTSVALTTPGLLFNVSGSPVTGAGTLAFSLKTQVANTFLAGPTSGADATPTMRALTQADLPAQPFDLTAFYPGVPSASARVTRVPVARTVTFPANFAGSVGIASVAATSSTAFDVRKNGASVGTITFAAGAATATFTTSGAVIYSAGDYLSIVAPATPDATLADPGFALAGTR